MKDKSPEEIAKLWQDEIRYAKQFWKKWEEDAKKLDKRYRDDEKEEGAPAKLNMFWSENQVLQSSVYARTPKAQVERRYKDKDPIGKGSSALLERATQYSVNAHQDFDAVMRGARNDYLIVGRGTTWERYVPHTESKTSRKDLVPMQISGELDETPSQASPEAPNEASGEAPAPSYQMADGAPFAGDPSTIQQDEQGAYAEEPYEDLTYEESITEFVPWGDYLCSGARNDEEVRWKGRKVHQTKAEIIKRFGEEFSDVPLDYISKEANEDSQKTNQEKDEFRQACIWELWDKTTKTVYWISEGYPKPLDQKADPLNLKNFFPCPKPLFASSTSTTIIPRPDYLMAQDQAREVDLLTDRIVHMIDAIRVNGAYDEQIKEDMKRVFFEGDNKLTPMRNWAQFIAQGGFESSVQFAPFEKSVEALKVLYEARERAKQDYYEVTGHSDIMRGATDPRETLGAQNLKAGFGNLRLKEKQEEMQRFVRDAIRIKAEIIAEHFSPETLKLMSGIDFMPPEFPGTFEDAVGLLRNDVMRCFRVDIETDSTINLNENEEKERRTEFLQALGGFLKDALPMAQQFPPLVPVLQEGVLFLVRGFKVGREMEAVIEQAMAQVGQMAGDQQQQAQEQQQQQQQADMQAQQQQGGQEDAQAKTQMMMQQLQLKFQEIQGKQDIAQQQQDLAQQKVQGELMLKNKEIESKLEAEIQMKREELMAQARKDAMAHYAELLNGQAQVQQQKGDFLPHDQLVTFDYDTNGKRFAKVTHVPREMPVEGNA